jgi:hypothetical protein
VSSTSLTTKDQLLKLFHAWGVTDQKPPTKSKKVIIAFPRTPQYDFATATVTVADHKSTYGKTLYQTILE